MKLLGNNSLSALRQYNTKAFRYIIALYFKTIYLLLL
nr:MAG TPA: hypothetical protein [Caudoviricetes sp.]